VLTAAVLAANAGLADLLRRVPGEFSLARNGQTLDVRVRLLARPQAARSSSSDRPPGRPRTAARRQPDAANSAS